MARGQRRYTEAQKAQALAMCETGVSQREVARALDVPRATLQEWLSGVGVNEAVAEQSATQKADLATVMEQLAHRAAGQALATIESASPAQAATVMGIAVDKMRLLRGEATSISQQQAPSSVEERDKELAAIVERVQLRAVNGGKSD